jgi:hypothetical protein
MRSSTITTIGDFSPNRFLASAMERKTSVEAFPFIVNWICPCDRVTNTVIAVTLAVLLDLADGVPCELARIAQTKKPQSVSFLSMSVS